jgi:hypothetical protein
VHGAPDPAVHRRPTPSRAMMFPAAHRVPPCRPHAVTGDLIPFPSSSQQDRIKNETYSLSKIFQDLTI